MRHGQAGQTTSKYIPVNGMNVSRLFLCRYADEGDDKGTDDKGTDDKGTDDKGTDDKDENKTFTQEQMDSVLANAKREHDAKMGEAIDELKSLRTKSTLNADERVAYDARLKELQKTSQTQEELAKERLDKATKKHTSELKAATDTANAFQQRYFDTLIRTEVVDASVKNNAWASDQIHAILGSQLKVTQKTDADGNVTDAYGVRVAYPTQKDGAEVTLDLSVDEAVIRMSEDDRYRNLFKQKGKGGFGVMGAPGSKGTDDIVKLAQGTRDARAFVDARNEQLGKNKK